MQRSVNPLLSVFPPTPLFSSSSTRSTHAPSQVASPIHSAPPSGTPSPPPFSQHPLRQSPNHSVPKACPDDPRQNCSPSPHTSSCTTIALQIPPPGLVGTLLRPPRSTTYEDVSRLDFRRAARTYASVAEAQHPVFPVPGTWSRACWGSRRALDGLRGVSLRGCREHASA